MQNKMKWIVAIILLVIMVAGAEQKPIMQIAILLDTSNSMDGLIQQAKTQLWSIANELAVNNAHQLSRFELALYEYGNSGLSHESGYIRQVVPLTEDIDKVSEVLFSLKTNGGSEYCGWAIRSAVQELAWSNLYSDHKVIFIAGNEEFTQGNVGFEQACYLAISNGVVVNTIHCGSYAEGVSGKWDKGAMITNGAYMIIDQDQRAVVVATPQDVEIVQLNKTLNATYLPYGDQGKKGKQRQSREDGNAEHSSKEGYIQRIVFKCSPYYRNSTWDMVDAATEGKITFEQLKSEDLPNGEMDKEQFQKHISKLAEQRKQIQAKIIQLEQERQAYLQKNKKSSKRATLKTAMIKALRKQLRSHNLGK